MPENKDKWNDYRKKYGTYPEFQKNNYEKMSKGFLKKEEPKVKSPWLDLDKEISKEKQED